jgi:antitoxin HicB
MEKNENHADTVLRKDLAYYLELPYRLEIVKSEHGDCVLSFPELPGCVTQIDDLADIAAMSREILTGWLELALEDGQDIPEPEGQPDYSGKFILRIARSLHRELAVAADREGVSLNAYAAAILAQGLTWRQANDRYEELSKKIDSLGQSRIARQSSIRAVGG